jgi:calcineurin-like phosphoesterase family protein
MARLIIPDIHQDHLKAEEIIAKVPHDSVVFLGDYFDQFHDTPSHAAATAQWLEKRIAEHPEDVFLIGNHDVQYLWGICRCSGYSFLKDQAIISAVKSVKSLRKHLKLYTFVDGWLVSHAGLTNHYVKGSDDPIQYLKQVADICMEKLEKHFPESHFLLEAGTDRGGWLPYGGITWCDWRKFEPIPGIKQLVGHTKSYLPRVNGDNHCIDTQLKHYAVIENGNLRVAESI